MIIHQQLMAGRAERVLVIVLIAYSTNGWLRCYAAFCFSLFDDSRYSEAQHDSDNPFETEQLVLCSLDFVRRNKQRF